MTRLSKKGFRELETIIEFRISDMSCTLRDVRSAGQQRNIEP